MEGRRVKIPSFDLESSDSDEGANAEVVSHPSSSIQQARTSGASPDRNSCESTRGSPSHCNLYAPECKTVAKSTPTQEECEGVAGREGAQHGASPEGRKSQCRGLSTALSMHVP